MITLLALVIAPFAVALFTAGVNFGVWAQRRHEDAHRWLAIACVATAALVAATGLLVTSHSREDALFARALVMFVAVPAVFGILRFWTYRFGVRLGRIEGYAIAGAVSLCALTLVPDAFYEPGEIVRTLGVSHAAYVDVQPNWFGACAPLAFVPIGLFLVARTFRVLPRHRAQKLILSLWTLALLALANDVLVLGTWFDGPYLFAAAFTAVGVVLTGYMMRRFVASMARVEASADLLQAAAEQRARELREADLKLAHGARLAALGTLAAGLAHEINNPVAFIRSNLNYLDELSREAGGDAEIGEVLAETEEGVLRVRGIVAELLRMSAQSEARFGDLDLGDVVESVLPTLRFEARDDVRLETRLTRLPRVWGDRNLLGQVIANLVMNAIQAVRGGGARGVVRIDTFAEGERVVLEVSDSGPGVAAEIEARIFEPFFTTKPAGEGTGLGLAVTRQLVDRLGGKIALVPAERGARFRVELPLATERDADAAALSA